MLITIPKARITASGCVVNGGKNSRGAVLEEVMERTGAKAEEIALFNSAFFSWDWKAASGLVCGGVFAFEEVF